MGGVGRAGVEEGVGVFVAKVAGGGSFQCWWITPDWWEIAIVGIGMYEREGREGESEKAKGKTNDRKTRDGAQNC